LRQTKKIIIIIQRSNGDVLLSSPLIRAIYHYYEEPQIDLLINDDTTSIAKLLPHINEIHTFSYQKKKDEGWRQEKDILIKLFKKYELSINLTASDRSVFYALLLGKKSISAVENDRGKSWWKKIFLTHYYYFDSSKHILKNNLESLNLLKIPYEDIHQPLEVSIEDKLNVKKRLKAIGVGDFVIFHPSTQYRYKVYPQVLRDALLSSLSELGLPIIITGGNNLLDLEIKKQIPSLPNVINFIGNTSLAEFIALSELSLGYIGMDTLNMHIAASQNKRIFAIFGPTNLKMWSPWSNQIKMAAAEDMPVQNYGNVTIFQADLPCVACGRAGCDDNHGNSDCLDNISPNVIFKEVRTWLNNKKNEVSIPIEIVTKLSEKKVLLYIVYGDDQAYYDGVKYSFLTFKNWTLDDNQVEAVVLTEKPEQFENYPIKVLSMSKAQKNEWSLGGSYHFRIKNRGLAYVMDELQLKDLDKILFFDADTYFHKSPLSLFDLITPNQALFYLNEGRIYDRKRFFTYVENLEGKKIEIDGEIYELTKHSALWGSLMVGIVSSMRPSLDWADKLMIKFSELVPAHTIEPFALSESLLRKYNLVEGKDLVSLYSTSRKKNYAKKIISNFFQKNKLLSIDEQVSLAQKVKIKRPFFVIVKQRFFKSLED